MVFIGKLDYHSIWCVAWLDPEITKYYFRLIPKYYYATKQRYDAHVTVVSKYDADNRDMSVWGKYQGLEVPIYPVGPLEKHGLFFGIDCESPALQAIRLELGLTPLMGGNISFHITVGNMKETGR